MVSQQEQLRRAVWNCRRIKANTKLVGLSLAEYYPEQRSLREIGQECGLCVRTVQDSLAELVKKELLSREKRPGRSHVYHFSPVSIPIVAFAADVTPPESTTPAKSAGVPPSRLAGVPEQNLPGSGSETSRPPFSEISRKMEERDPDACGERARSDFSEFREIPEKQAFTDISWWIMPAEMHEGLVSDGLTPDEIAWRLGDLLNRKLKRPGIFNVDRYVSDKSKNWLKWKREGATLPSMPVCGAGTAPRIDFPEKLVRLCGGWQPGPAEVALAVRIGADVLEQFRLFARSGAPQRLNCTERRRDDFWRSRMDPAFNEWLRASSCTAEAAE